MAPKGHRATASLRSHSRTSSNSKISLALQFAQKDALSPKHLEKIKKNVHVAGHHDPNPRNTSPFPRTNSAIRNTKEAVQQAPPRLPPTPSGKPNSAKHKAGFTIASPGEDEDEWISSESGAVTPSGHESESDVEEATTPVEQRKLLLNDSVLDDHGRPEANLPRVSTARPSDYGTGPSVQTLPGTRRSDAPSYVPLTQNVNSDVMDTQSDVTSLSHHNYRPPKRSSVTRPPSTHSIASRSDHPLRPHPLIRGQSYGQVLQPVKPGPLAPLTVIAGIAPPLILPSAPLITHGNTVDFPSTSPSSIRTVALPSSPSQSSSSQQQLRHTSISPAHSAVTLPVPHGLREQSRTLHDRTRTLSTLSLSSSSSAALSSLAHLPAISRPPSPQRISFFPPINPHAHLEDFHPLLPPPYLASHMTVLARRTPMRESYDRVMRAKQIR